MTTHTASEASSLAAEAAAFRARFPIFARRVHLATNAKGALSDAGIEAQAEYQESWIKHGAPWDAWSAKHEELRAACARLIGADQGEVALCYSVTQALSGIASALTFDERRGVVVDGYSFPSVVQMWRAQAPRGAEVRSVRPGTAEVIDPQAFEDIVDETANVVSVAHLCYKNGHRLDLEGVRQRAHAAGALFVVDDYQSFGSRTLDVRAGGYDVYTAGMVKWAMGSPGVVLLYVSHDVLDCLHPTATGWFGQVDPGAFQIDRHEEAAGATRFQIGTPAIPAIYDSLAGIELLESVGLTRIERWIARLTTMLIERLEEHGISFATPADPARRGPQVAIRATDAPRAVAELAARGIVVSSREECVRTAWHFYNNEDDVDALVTALLDLGPLVVRGEARDAA